MDYFWIFCIPIALLFVAGIFDDTSTWSPFQSEQVREICAHMTRTERRAAVNRGVLWGITIGVVPAAIGLLGVLVFRSMVGILVIYCLVFPLEFVVITLALRKRWWPGVLQSPRDFLASTEWAKSQGIEADDIRLYRWQE